jgi:uncharacterized protein involved in response to NO
MGLYIGPAISGHEPRFQRFGVNFLFACLLIIVVGAFAGQWLAVMQKLGLDRNFWFGHQGWEYVDLGRFWQLFLFIGLGVWLMHAIIMQYQVLPAFMFGFLLTVIPRWLSRPLVLGKTAGFAFVVVQAVAVLRVLAELLPDTFAWHALAGVGWIVAFMPWVLRSGRIYLSPRADGQPG